MSSAIKIYQGRFGRVALLDMDAPLVQHAHHHCHLLIKAAGPDTFFSVHDALQPLTDDTAVLVNPWEPHAYRHYENPEQPHTVILAMYIETDWLTEIRHPLGGSGHPQFFPQPCVRMSAQARKLAEELSLEMWWSDSIASERLEGLLFELMISVIDPAKNWREMSRQMELANRRPSDPRIRKAIAWLRENTGADPDMNRLAEHCGLSRAHFFALFHRCTGVTPNVYLNVLRMESAIRDLSEGTSSLTDISYDIGFSAPAHFTRFFRQHLGITPSEYRRVVELYDSERGQVQI
ncbi:AraC family transcriptional regulator [Trinickia symbiotica]|uniref:AraC family transcriptional regulator n=1 Tax=Trinickia symbiotica TaxID=863227 RepID=A0A2N7X161_9BURK|nr:AraC family transcriptional regulator [Trinickia symbiotica]PMS35466.1 AraC family transcriptional regulator [Trinickia symbiotica]PPK45495.1 AraC family transcriptional regulator [Trinickia symbiotica]